MDVKEMQSFADFVIQINDNIRSLVNENKKLKEETQCKKEQLTPAPSV